MAEGAGAGPVVSDTSPLINLAAVGLLPVLAALYGQVVIPEAVRDEYAAGRRPGEPALGDLGWLVVTAVALDPALSDVLGPGEAAAIALATATRARALLLDERAGRRVAAARGLPVVGTLAVVLRAKRAGLVPAVRPVVDTLIARGMRLSLALRARVLREAGEEAG